MAYENNEPLDKTHTSELDQGIVENDAANEIETKKKEKLMPVPPEINELMSTIDELLQHGEEVPDSLIQELESQINTAGDFEVEELFQKYSKASSFYGVSSLLNDAHRRAQLHHGFGNEEEVTQATAPTEESNGIPVMPYIPPASDDDLMEYMSQGNADYEPEQIPAQEKPNVPEARTTAPSAEVTSKKDTLESKESLAKSPDQPTELHRQYPRPAEQAVNDAKANEQNKKNANKVTAPSISAASRELPPKEDTTTKANGVATSNHPVGISQQLQVSSKPLLGSLAGTFNSMMGLTNKNKLVETHMSSSDFGKNIVANKITDFEKLCLKHLGSIENISDLAKLSAGTFNDKGDEIIKSKVADFTKMSEVIGKEYRKLLESVSKDDEQVNKIKSIAKEHAEKLNATKGTLSKILGDNAPSSLVKLLGGVMESVKSITNKTFQIRPEAEKQKNVTSEPQLN